MKNVMPDIARNTVADSIKIDEVGMTDMEVVVSVESPSLGMMRLPGKADALISLNRPEIKGIHMSRVYLAIQDALNNSPISFKLIEQCLHNFLVSHSNLSETASLWVGFELPIMRSSLKSSLQGWRFYPVQFMGKIRNGEVRLKKRVRVAYSSTCPCSAALARQLIQNEFRERFPHSDVKSAEVYEWLGSESGICATPHGQRSYATITVVPRQDSLAADSVVLIDTIEAALGTPVQSAVKREDEQEFARLNGENAMFVEDSVRKIAIALESLEGVEDYLIESSHQESLHPHNAVATQSKGIQGGMKSVFY